MYPNAFLRNFWQMELRPQVFVAMAFNDRYRTRYNNIIAPAIRNITVQGTQLNPLRVDFSESGDSILTEIIDGISHARLVLADVSTVGYDSVTGKPYRNGNVMYEVGIALACRQSAEVLLIRDDESDFLFDISTIPHKKMDFSNEERAREELTNIIVNRLNEINYINDTRVKMIYSTLSQGDIEILRQVAPHGLAPWGWDAPQALFVERLTMSRLLDKNIIELAGQGEDQRAAYRTTPLGLVVAQIALKNFPRPHTANSEPDQEGKDS